MSSQTTAGFIKSPVQSVRLGKPSSRSLDFFHLCSYDVDGLRELLQSPGFSETYDINEPAHAATAG